MDQKSRETEKIPKVKCIESNSCEEARKKFVLTTTYEKYTI